MDKKWCVYLHIIHTDCGYDKYYVGITSQRIERRWKNGFGYTKNTYFYRAIKKYKWENIEHIVLESNLSEDEAKKKEKYYIKKYKSFQNQYGYNLTLGGEGTVGYIMSDETKDKISLANSGVNSAWYGKHHTILEKEKISKGNKGKQLGKKSKLHKKVYQYSMDTGKFIQGYDSVRDAERITNIPHDRISRCCNNKLKSAGGYIWNYNKYDFVESYIKYEGKNIIQYDKNHTMLNIYNSVNDILENNSDYKANNIYCCLSGKNKTSYGFIWEYA